MAKLLYIIYFTIQKVLLLYFVNRSFYSHTHILGFLFNTPDNSEFLITPFASLHGCMRFRPLFFLDQLLQIPLDLGISQSGNGNGDARNQLRFKPPQGDNIQRVHKIAPPQRVKHFRQFLFQLPVDIIAAHDPVNAN